MATFRNPNNPPQPQPGVYGWFVDLPEGSRCLYIGNAGDRKPAMTKSTLLRGVVELSREPFTSDSNDKTGVRYTKLDTNFVVGSAIKYFEIEYGPVFWKHLDDDPEKNRTVRQICAIASGNQKGTQNDSVDGNIASKKGNKRILEIAPRQDSGCSQNSGGGKMRLFGIVGISKK